MTSNRDGDRLTGATFREMLREVRVMMEKSQQDFAANLGYSPQHLCDLESGRRMPSVAFVNRLCDYLSRGPVGRRVWHLAGAEAHGWQVTPRAGRLALANRDTAQ